MGKSREADYRQRPHHDGGGWSKIGEDKVAKRLFSNFGNIDSL